MSGAGAGAATLPDIEANWHGNVHAEGHPDGSWSFDASAGGSVDIGSGIGGAIESFLSWLTGKKKDEEDSSK
ncbi:hypothetical protein [Rhizobium leguminosarum]|uniref:hypothetical protein n=1 Tax=Rhizobium leguminosarum TaxID=384 RepID=UPI001C90969D|nr:hypothetical protein [Rhizobium leguminosarum]MBY2986679.1 hypothetical protein [Rhizobium leguminosarum]